MRPSSYVRALAPLGALAASLHGLLTSRHLHHAGLTRHAVATAVAHGFLTHERDDVYACAGAPITERRTIMAAALAAGPGAWASHSTAARLWELELPRAAVSSKVELTVRRGRMPDLEGVVLHRTLHLARGDVTRVDSIPVTSVARTVVDLSGRLGPTALGKLVDDVVFAKIATTSEIAVMSERLPRAKGRSKKKLRVVLANRGDLDEYESQLEAFVFDALRRWRVELPEAQARVTASGNSYRLDGFYDRTPPIALEADGWSIRRRRSKFDADRQKDRDLRNAGFVVLRFTSADTDWRIASEVAKALGADVPPEPPSGGMTYHEWKRRRDLGRP